MRKAERKELEMTKRELIGRITEINRSARAEFLAEFSEAELQHYLTNLEAIWADFREQFAEPEMTESADCEQAALLVG